MPVNIHQSGGLRTYSRPVESSLRKFRITLEQCNCKIPRYRHPPPFGPYRPRPCYPRRVRPSAKRGIRTHGYERGRNCWRIQQTHFGRVFRNLDRVRDPHRNRKVSTNPTRDDQFGCLRNQRPVGRFASGARRWHSRCCPSSNARSNQGGRRENRQNRSQPRPKLGYRSLVGSGNLQYCLDQHLRKCRSPSGRPIQRLASRGRADYSLHCRLRGRRQ